MSNHLYDRVFAPHEDNPKPFLIGETQTLSYAIFHEQVNKLAHTLIANGLKTGAESQYKRLNQIPSLLFMWQQLRLVVFICL